MNITKLITNMLMLLFVLLVSSSINITAVSATGNSVIITELSSGSSESASDEFIELFNPTESMVVMTNVAVEYQSASGTTWTSKLTINASLEPHAHMLIVTDDYLSDADINFNGGIASAGGVVRLRQNELVLDSISWGNAKAYYGSQAPATKDGFSLSRKMVENNLYQNTQINADDFMLADMSPQSQYNPESDSIKVVQSNNAIEKEIDYVSDTVTTVAKYDYSQIKIWELFIDPVKPKTDADDEAIEIYNTGTTAVNIEGMVIETGKNLDKNYTFKYKMLEPNQFHVIKTSQSKLSLPNSSSQIRLLSPDGNVVDGISYDKVKAGYSLSNSIAGWQWSKSVTLGQANVFGDSQIATNATTIAKAPAPIDESKSAKTTKNSATKPNLSATESASKLTDQIQSSPLSNWPWLVAGIGLLLVFVIYEYRYEVAIKFKQLRGYLSNRQTNWFQFARR